MTEQRFHTPDGMELRVDIPAGQIDVSTVDGDESVVVVEGDERVVEQTRVELEGRTLIVGFRGRKPFGLVFSLGSLGNGRLRVRATVPHGADARIATASADAQLDGRFGSVELTTASGDLTARGEIERDATLKTVSGDVRVERIGGRLRCQTVSGDIEVGSVGGSAELKSVSGDVRVECLRQGESRFTSVSGDIAFGIAPGSFLDVDAGSVSGSLSSEVALAGMPVGVGEDGPTVVLRGKTVSGDVKVFRAS